MRRTNLKNRDSYQFWDW